ncbi:hypothetical protein CCACVL1_22937 [Corchorus capsularis]|uniref:Uncharacterized protein n=1 Tax=Corchorus capsularis TaxID=210143 RepID=A0A1R3GW72_COCAP|nr:hypothetical protein CCACVL1_22937 [Corchorus capsularis]
MSPKKKTSVRRPNRLIDPLRPLGHGSSGSAGLIGRVL